MRKLILFPLVLLMLFAGCAAPAATEVSAQTDTQTDAVAEVLSAETVAKSKYDITSEDSVIYLAGGCFWGVQKYLDAIPGVVKTVVGYANGQWEGETPPTYKDVSSGLTGFRETVYLEYNPEEVSLDTILFAYFYVIDPTVINRQGPDVGSEYQSGIYYTNAAAKEVVDRVVEIERERYGEIHVEIEPLEVFYEAEEAHQKYLEKNPSGYCHIGQGQIDWMKQMIVDASEYVRPEKPELYDLLTPLQYQVTQENYTEEPFNNEYWNTYEKGIYVDIVSGEPLFSSLDKYESSCGWPAFSKGIDVNTFFFAADYLLDTPRLEVRSRSANSHLGHVFQSDAESPTGTRYCINSAAIRFIPYEEMEEQGYGYLTFLFEEEPSEFPTITAQEAKALIDQGDVLIVDVRENYEYQQGHIPGAVSLPVGSIGPSSGELIGAREDSIVLVCSQSDERNQTAADYLVRAGCVNLYLFGGMDAWPYAMTKK